MKKIEQFQITSLMLSGFKSYEEPTESIRQSGYLSRSRWCSRAPLKTLHPRQGNHSKHLFSNLLRLLGEPYPIGLIHPILYQLSIHNKDSDSISASDCHH